MFPHVPGLVFPEPFTGSCRGLDGRVRFVQVVGLTLDEYEAARGGNTAGVLRALEPRMPLHVTDIERGSLLPAS